MCKSSKSTDHVEAIIEEYKKNGEAYCPNCGNKMTIYANSDRDVFGIQCGKCERYKHMIKISPIRKKPRL